MKGVILAGGTGTRLHPLTQITNKHLLPIYDRPMVAHAIEALVSVGIKELMVVTGGTHAGEFLRLLGDGHEYGIERLSFAYQESAAGIADALGKAERFAGGERIVVMLADNVFGRTLRPAVESFRAQEYGGRLVLARLDEPQHLRHLGVAELDGNGRIARIVEKPEDPPSDLAVTGVYFYDPAVFEVIPTLEASGRGELEITDVPNHYPPGRRLFTRVYDGHWTDAGTVPSLLRAAELAAEDDDARRALQAGEKIVLAALVVVQAADHPAPREGDVRLERRLREPALAADLHQPASLVGIVLERDDLHALDHDQPLSPRPVTGRVIACILLCALSREPQRATD